MVCRRESWELQRLLFINKLVQKNPQYKMIFGGSSVTAGHDNGHRQSYVYVWEDRMKPVFEALGVDLIVNNIAQGANDCIPSNLCYEAMGGENADFFSWEQSFNCGHSESVFELSARWAILEKGYGSIYFAESGGWNPFSCPDSTDPIPYSSPDWTPESAKLPFWKAGTVEIERYKKMMFDFKPPATRRLFLCAYQSSHVCRFSSYISKYPKFTKQFAVSGISFQNGFFHPDINVSYVLPATHSVKPRPQVSPLQILYSCKLKAFTREASVYVTTPMFG